MAKGRMLGILRLRANGCFKRRIFQALRSGLRMDEYSLRSAKQPKSHNRSGFRLRALHPIAQNRARWGPRSRSATPRSRPQTGSTYNVARSPLRSPVQPIPQEKTRRSLSLSQRRALVIPLAAGIVLLFGLVFSQQAFNLHLSPDSAEQTLVLVALSAIVFLLLVTLTFVLLRNLLKLYAERRLGVLGSRFRTRMVLGALALSFAPALVMFLFAYGLMNRSIDKWFSGPVAQLQQDTGHMVTLLSEYAGDNARQEAVEIAQSARTVNSFETAKYSGVVREFPRHQPTLQGGFAIALADGNAVATWNSPQPWLVLRGQLPDLGQVVETPRRWTFVSVEYLLAVAPVGTAGKILVGLPLPKDFTPTLDQINQKQQEYLALSRETK